MTSAASPTSHATRTLGIIGGSGLYDMEGLSHVEEVAVETPFGAPSDKIIRGQLDGTRMLFLPRHGRGHRWSPSRINYRANLFALKQLGAEQIVSVSAVGSLQEHIAPGDLLLPDQYIDRTVGRARTFFDDFGMVAHVGFSDPIDVSLSHALAAAADKTDARVHRGGTYVCIEGPQFSTRAESHLFRSWGCHVIGMTNLPEARLAREAELPYASLSLVTDYDCWHEGHDAVTLDAVLAVMHQNVAKARAVLRNIAGALPDPTKSPASSALSQAIVTAREHISAETRRALSPLIGKYIS